MPEFGQKWPKSSKRPKNRLFGDPGIPAGRGFTSTPRGDPPVTPGGGKGGFPASRAGERSPGPPGEVPRGSLGPWSRLRPPGNRGAPARGVDVKPPSRDRSRDPGVPGRASQAPLGALGGIPGPCPGGLGPRSPGPGPREAPGGPRGLPARPGRPAGGCFTSTPRGGAPRFPAGPGPETPRSVESLQAVPRPRGVS